MDDDTKKKIDECKDVIELPAWDVMFKEKN